MITKLKYFTVMLFLGLFGWLGFSTYNYFFDATGPRLSIVGLKKDCYYAGDVQCTIASNKVGDISVWLDGQSLIQEFRINNKEYEHPFEIPTKTIPNGKHVLRAEFTDTTFHKNKAALEQPFLVDNVGLQAAFVKPEAEYKVFQGRTLHVQLQVNKEIQEAKVTTLAHSYPCFAESKNSLIYEAFIPIPCEEKPNEYLLSVDVIDQVGNALRLDSKFQVVVYPFKKQTLNISQAAVKEEEKLGLDERKFEEIIAELTKNSSREKFWRGAFCTPIDVARVTCEFGTMRTTQQRGRYAHKAIDVINTPKSVVWASQDGKVVLKDRFEISGNTVIIDHGWGILSMYFHLDDFAKIDVNNKIAKGNPIGTIGKTGYATGYHLHWEMRLNNIPVDPMQWTKTTF